MERIAPNLIDRAYLWRPTAAFSDPPLCTIADLRTTLTLNELADMHEALDLRDAAQAKHADKVEREAARRRSGGGRR